MLRWIISVFISIYRTIIGDKKIRYSGKAGMIFTFNNSEYFIDSEMLAGEYDMVIFAEHIVLNSDRSKIDRTTKDEVLAALIVELKRQRTTFEIWDGYPAINNPVYNWPSKE